MNFAQGLTLLACIVAVFVYWIVLTDDGSQR